MYHIFITLFIPVLPLPDQQPDQRPTTTSVTLLWSPLITQVDDFYRYEVGYIARPGNTQCTDSNYVTLPDGYTLLGNTTGNSIVVTSLQPGTCYLFGVRVYSSLSEVPGGWTLLLQQTLQLCEYNV